MKILDNFLDNFKPKKKTQEQATQVSQSSTQTPQLPSQTTESGRYLPSARYDNNSSTIQSA